MNIYFTCDKCNKAFCVEYQYLSQKSEIICPNCGDKYDEQAFGYLKEGTKNIIDATQSTYKWKIAIDIN